MPQGSQKEVATELKNYGYSTKIKLRGFYKTDTDKIFKTKPFDFDIEKALAVAQ
jgi:hypothetical protein